jgi:hypothetical protein
LAKRPSATLLAIVADLRRDHDIAGLILGGRKLLLILHAGDAPGVPFRRTTRVHAHPAVGEHHR